MCTCLYICCQGFSSLTEISVTLNGTYGINYNVLCNIVDSSSIDEFCAACRKGVRRSLASPYHEHSFLNLSLSCILPLFEEICKRFNKCIFSKSALSRSLTVFSIIFKC